MRTPISLIALLLFGLLGSMSAQDRSISTLPIVQRPGAVLGQGVPTQDTSAYNHAKGIYNRLVQARGDFRYPVPKFVMNREKNRVAGMDYNNLEIILEEEAYQVCQSYGDQADAAIAFLLGHELAHYYEKHGWRRGFARDYKDLDIGLRLDSIADGAANETEADYLGGFLAYSAGFGLFDQGGDVIRKLYERYEFEAELPGYPSLSDRQELGRRTAVRIRELADVFDMANLLVALGRYTEAYDYYRYILMRYQSRELHNNVGVTAVLDALEEFKPNELKYRYPVQLDLDFSASKGDGMGSSREKKLRQAILHFDAAISLDPNYAPAYLNKACALALLGDIPRARFYAELEAGKEDRRAAYPKTGIDVDVLLGILEATEGRETEAADAFEAAAVKGSALAEYNLKVLKGETTEAVVAPSFRFPRTEMIDGKAIQGMTLDELSTLNLDTEIYVNLKRVFYQDNKFGENSRLFINNNMKEVVLLHKTKPGYTGKTARDIGLGDSRTAIVAAYGEPLHTLETPRGEILRYSSLLFLLDGEGKLESWATHFISTL